MTEDLIAINRRLKLIENDIEGERSVSRHILRKVSENENALLELTKTVNRIEERLVLFQAELPRQLAAAVAEVLREELARQK